MRSKTCIIVSGPTAVGKTAYAINLALQYQTEIISADSRQCFKELNIGVAKPSPVSLGTVKHFFINSHSIFDTVNAKVFEEYALKSINSIFEKNDVAIMVGGTGLYIKAFCEGFDEVPVIKEDTRKHIFENYQSHGVSWLQSELNNKDPLYFEQGEMKNPQRMMRALEVILSTGNSIYNFHSGEKISRDFDIRHILLEMPRAELYDNINNRVDAMIKEGLLDEVKSLFPYKHLNALQTVGYKELFAHLDGHISFENAIDLIKKNTRHYAKRQNTWFKKFIPL